MPYLSVVGVARNSNHQHLQSFVESWCRQAGPLGLSLEVILVAVGPIGAVAGARVIEVASEMREPAAKNAGIRQARGEFILSVEIDIVCSAELLEFLAARRLRKGRLYRIDLHEGNCVHSREGTFRLTADGLREHQPEDITARESGIYFGEGWFPAGRDAKTGEPFRWMENGAEVILQASALGGAVALDLEPGPGVGPLPQALQVLDAAGALVAEWSIAGRTALQLWVPPAPPGKSQAFRLSVPDGGRPLPDDLRILNFRCFRCDWVCSVDPPSQPRSLLALRPTLTRLVRSGGAGALADTVRLLQSAGADIFGAGVEYWGEGWHRLEVAGTERFRWVSSDAELVVRVAGGQQDLCLLVEPGPSLNGLPFHLQIRLAGGKMIGRVEVNGMTLVRVPLPLAAGTVAAVFLSPDRQGEALPGDSRVLNCRVLACACEPSRSALPALGLECWPAVTVSQRPAGIDWAARLERHRRELAEIGKPAFLHVNACDFILMHREHWHDLRGFPEADYPAESLNTLFCYAAHFSGIQEEVLREPLRIDGPACADHAPNVPDQDLVWLITQMRRLHAPAILNLDTWGLDVCAQR